MADRKETPKPSAAKSTTTAKPATSTTAKPATSTTAKPATSTAAKPATTSTARPATTSTARPATTTAARPATSTTARPATTSTARPATSTTAKPATTSTAKPATSATAKPATSTTAKPATTTAAKPAASTAAKPASGGAKFCPECGGTLVGTRCPKCGYDINKKTSAPGKTTGKAETAATASAAVSKMPPAKSDAKPKAAAMTSSEKAKKSNAKASNAKASKSGAKGGGAATATKDNKLKIIIISAVCFVVILALVLGLVFGIKGCSGNSLKNQNALAINNYPAMTKVSYFAEETAGVSRNKPVDGVKDEHEAFGTTNGYPKYGSTLRAVIGTDDDKVAARNALIAESEYLAAYGTRGANNDGKANDADKYTWMNKDGYLFRGSVSEPVKAMEIASYNASTGDKTYSNVQRRLYKHTASVGLYLGDVADDEPAITKRITLSNRGYTSYSLTGVYAPAGEVLTVKLSGEAMNATNGIAINIGQALYNSQANNIWASKNVMNRIPHVLTTLSLNKNTMTYNEETDTWTGYIGSFIGGPVYVQNESSTFTLEISGGVTYQHFILGYTTPEEFAKNSQSSAPMFDLEVWEYGVLHSGPKTYAKNFSYDDLYDAAVYWEKVSLVTTQRGNGYKQGIVFIYDPFVAAGAAVAFPGRSSVNCPLGWMSSSLNCKAMVTSGSWGNMHEYHHNFQGFGVGGGADGEVTNNSLNLVSYALFTNISAKRGIGSFGAAGLGGWNNYTVGTWTLNQINNKSISSTNGLAVYATLLHNFGPDAYIKNAKGSNLAYWNNWSNFTGYDMSYYANLVSTYATGEKPAANSEKPMFIPVSCVYQTGRSYGTGENKKYITTTRPYVIPFGNDFDIDLSTYSAPGGQYASGSIVLPTNQDANQTARFEYTVKSVSQPEHGKIEKIDDLHYKFVPDTGNLDSGKIIVTLGITDKTGVITNIDDVDLVLGFRQSHEMNKMTLERTTYTYDADKMYTDAVDAFNAGFKNYSSVVTENQYNPVQNVNTDIWFRPDTEKYRNDYPNDPEKYFIHENQIDVVDGKLYFAEDGKYRVYLRGRVNCALYFSFDGKDYKLGGTIKSEKAEGAPNGWANSQFRPFDSNTYFDAQFDKGTCTVTVYVGGEKTYDYKFNMDASKQYRNWIYTKEVLIDQKTPAVSYIGVGTAQWSLTMFSMSETYHDANKKLLLSSEDENYAYTQNTYTNYAGVSVAATQTSKDGTVKHYSISGGKYTEITGAQLAELTEPKLIEPTSATYANAYRRTYEFNTAGFTSEYFYTRSYAANYINNVELTSADSVTLMDTNYNASKVPSSWGKFPVTNITDGNKNSYIHTHWKPSEASPLNFTFDIGKEVTANRITITARNHNNMGEGPGSFKLLGSTDGVAWFDVAEYENLPRASTTSVNFPETTLQYFKVSITHSQPTAGGATDPYYVVIGSITLTHSTEVTGGDLYSPDNAMFTYSGKWSTATVHSNYGHVFVGQKGATVNFEFEGTRLGVVSSNRLGQNFEVYIDGKLVESRPLKEDNGTFKYTYLSQKLSGGKHKVQIKCTGEANFDSFAVFNEAEEA